MTVISKVDLVVDDDPYCAGKVADNNGEKGEGVQTGFPAANLAKCDGVRLVEEKEDPVDEGLVEGQESQNWLRAQKP
jgi:hypothetical protein